MVAFFDYLDLFLEQNAGPVGAMLCVIAIWIMGVAIVEMDVHEDE